MEREMVFRDKTIRCVDCGASFIFTSGEASYYFQKQLIEPKRCRSCREMRRRSILPWEARR